jgi:ketosteroid isomerase-like protein
VSQENLDLVRSIYADWERGDFSSAEWADPEIELVIADGPLPGSWNGIAAMADVWRDYIATWDAYRVEALEYRSVDQERVLVLVRFAGHGKMSGVEVAGTQGASLFRVRDGKVARLAVYWDRDRALADLGLAPEGDAP